MDRARYGAFLILSLVFLSITFAHSFRFPYKNEILTDTVPAAPVQDPESHRAASVDAVRPFPGFPIDINTATKEELMVLPSIGDKTAARIIEKRRELGGFRSVDELTGVKWIGKVKLGRIRHLITVNSLSNEKKDKASP
ncbi:MAG: helix-hairpin-helix domain-containing protein [Deltaproteobacteria bacterium]|nr:helix-hairpin-helix domain-containing protein [Deltaproteobacteria bacterium]